MNLLAHLHLSAGCSPEALTGNVLADYLTRYDPPEGLSPAVRKAIMPGVLLHREIDGFTDRHPVVAEARQLISPQRRRLAGIIVDIAFDYYLSRHWSRFSGEQKSIVISRGYATMAMVSASGLSARTQSLIAKMRTTDWLAAYGTLEGQALTFRMVSQRTPSVRDLLGSEDEIVKQDRGFEDCFLRFYPELQEQVGSLLRSMNH